MITKKYYISELKVGCWNINGIFKRINRFRYNKLETDYCIRLLQSHHIFGVIESHHLATEIHQLHINGYTCFNTCRPKTTNNISGGLINSIYDIMQLQGVQKISKGGSKNICNKLKKELFATVNDIYLVFSYCGTSSSQDLRKASLDARL